MKERKKDKKLLTNICNLKFREKEAFTYDLDYSWTLNQKLYVMKTEKKVLKILSEKKKLLPQRKTLKIL